jgi:hypothetical protein
MNEPLIRFYLGAGADHRGRRLSQILARDDSWLESTHDFIQWLFPLREPSGVMDEAPLLDPVTEAAFATDEDLHRNLGTSFARMLRFYGFEDSGGAIRPGPAWDARTPDWFRGDTHNNLRITRILTSLCLLGRGDDARRFHAALEDAIATRPVCGIGAQARAYWARAAALADAAPD